MELLDFMTLTRLPYADRTLVQRRQVPSTVLSVAPKWPIHGLGRNTFQMHQRRKKLIIIIM